MLRNVLLLTWSYPPRNSSASRRSGCFAKYLPEYGWYPVVVCPEWTPENCDYDVACVTNIPDVVEVAPVHYPDPGPLGLFAFLKSRARSPLLPAIGPGDYPEFAKKVIADLFKERQFSAIWATSPNPVQHLLADWASRRWGVPWIADFRDIFGQFKKESLGQRLRLPFRVFQEKGLLRSAAEIVTHTDGVAQRLARRHGRAVHMIPNGFDPDGAAVLSGYPPAKLPRFNITYTGILSHRNPRPVLDALARLIDGGHIDPTVVSVDLQPTSTSRTVHRFQCLV